ncbi:MAG: hypothetical protein MUE59_16315 [Thiobacillaceae bacterium]|jgi:hypothetical protein|nr:hypothetical protein [Thiobacillaceae bacterium]MCU0918852.1 hypothetical protein [Burkholderiaceae bacterium]MCU0965265.1 hypothetical protein [Burkholderiaceae bacterium]
MRNQSVYIARGLGVAVLSLLLVACGGGGDDGNGSQSGTAPPDTASIDCLVLDALTAKTVAEAAVVYQAGEKTYTTQTNASGQCRLDMPASEVVGVKYPAATVTKTGYEPQTMLMYELKAGRSYYSEARLNPLAENMSIPVGGDTVMHLGDEVFEGSVNSQFQKATDGSEWVFQIANWAEQVKKPGVTKATVYLDAKGWQSDICDNRIALSGEIGTVSLPGGVSPSDGLWGGGRQVPFVFDVAKVGTLKGELRITAGTCANDAIDDLDDFEINRIRVEFN